MLSCILLACLLASAGASGSNKTEHEVLVLKDCQQSSNFDATTKCEFAIDKNLKRWSRVGSIPIGWWSAKTERDAHVKEVIIFTNDEFGFRLNYFTISVDGIQCASRSSYLIFFWMRFACEGYGRTIKISSNMPYLTLAEVYVIGELIEPLTLADCNFRSAIRRFGSCKLAIDRDVTQTSDSQRTQAKQVKPPPTFPELLALKDCQQSSDLNATTKCEFAIDKNLRWQSQVGSEPTGWWSAKTERDAHVKAVIIYNREDCCRDRLNNFTISVDGIQCASHASATTFLARKFACEGYGRTVNISSNMPYLTLVEVYVIGELIEPLTLANCSLRSANRSFSSCKLAIDRDVTQTPNRSSCSVAGLEPARWTGRTLKLSNMKVVRIYNGDSSQKQLSDFTISVDGIQCASHNSGEKFSVKSFKCGAYGRSLEIASNQSYLTLCEVQVFGEIAENCREVSVGTDRFCVLQQRLDGSVAFNRTWDEYVNGFGDDRNFWAGLAWLNRVTSKPGERIFRAELTSWTDQKTHVAEYLGFRVSDASTNFTMDYDVYLSRDTMYDDSLYSHRGRQFSTIDRDNAVWPSVRNNSGIGGWWFSSFDTFESNPNGFMPDHEISGPLYEHYNIWHGVHDNDVSLKATRLLIEKLE